jgi:hypothetical protein
MRSINNYKIFSIKTVWRHIFMFLNKIGLERKTLFFEYNLDLSLVDILCEMNRKSQLLI